MSDQSGADAAEPSLSRRPLGSAPPTVATAVRLMYIRAALGVIGLAATLATKNVLREQIQHRHPDLSSAQLDAATNAAAFVGLFTASIFIALYLGLGMLVRRGEGWARLVTLALAALGALGTLVSLVAPAPLPARILSMLQAGLDVAIIVYLTRPASAAYFRRAA